MGMNEVLHKSSALTRFRREIRLGLLSRSLEPEIRILPFLVSRDKAAVDVGANVGLYTHALLKLAKSVVSIEANPQMVRHLQNVYGHRATIINAAATNEKMQLTLRIPNLGPRGTGLATVAPQNDLSGNAVSEVAVPGIPLSEIVGDIGPIGFIKIDVEGHELAVLEGGVDVLRRDMPVILLEAEDRHRPSAVRTVTNFLSALGYRGFVIDGGQIKNLDLLDIERRQNIGQSASDSLNTDKRPAGYINNFIFIP